MASYLIRHHYDIGDQGVTIVAPDGFDAVWQSAVARLLAHPWNAQCVVTQFLAAWDGDCFALRDLIVAPTAELMDMTIVFTGLAERWRFPEVDQDLVGKYTCHIYQWRTGKGETKYRWRNKLECRPIFKQELSDSPVPSAVKVAIQMLLASDYQPHYHFLLSWWLPEIYGGFNPKYTLHPIQSCSKAVLTVWNHVVLTQQPAPQWLAKRLRALPLLSQATHVMPSDFRAAVGI